MDAVWGTVWPAMPLPKKTYLCKLTEHPVWGTGTLPGGQVMPCKLSAIPSNLVAQRFLKWAKCAGQFAQGFGRTDAPFEMAGAYTFQRDKRRPMPNLRDRLHEPGIDQRYKVCCSTNKRTRLLSLHPSEGKSFVRA